MANSTSAAAADTAAPASASAAAASDTAAAAPAAASADSAFAAAASATTIASDADVAAAAAAPAAASADSASAAVAAATASDAAAAATATAFAENQTIWACEAIPSLGSKCGTMLGASFIQRSRCTRWKLKKLSHVSFSTFFDDEIDCFEVLSPTPEEEQEPYMQSISDVVSERVHYTHKMSLCKMGARGRGKGKGKGRARDGDAVRERIVRQRTSGPVISDPVNLTPRRESAAEPHEPAHTDSQRRSSPIRGPHKTASSPTLGTEETAPITNFDTLFTRLRLHIDSVISSTVQQIYRYVDETVEKSAKETRRHIDEVVGHGDALDPSRWDIGDIPDFMNDFTHNVSDPTEARVAHTEQTEGIPIPAEHQSRGESVNVGAACGASASWFLMLHDRSKLIDAEHLDAYMGILQFDPSFVGMRWLDDRVVQTVLVHTNFLATCSNIWNNYKRNGGSLIIDADDLDFLVSHVHDLRPFWVYFLNNPRVDHLEYVSIVLVRTLGSSLHPIRGEYDHHARFPGAGPRCIFEVKSATGIGFDLVDSYHSTVIGSEGEQSQARLGG
ncbi:hypothetical protein OROGR_029872 [Orobanche gracilis]